MTTTTLRLDKKTRVGAFTLIEVMISSALMGFVLVGLLSTFIFILKSSKNITNYVDMEKSARKALEVFAEDSRQASDVVWSQAASDQYLYNGVSTPAKLTLTVNGVTIYYWYNKTTQVFVRQVAGGAEVKLLTGVDQFQFQAFQILNPAMDPAGQNRTSIGIDLSTLSTSSTAWALANNMTRQIQISLRTSRSAATMATATSRVLSARFILRNKLIVN